MPTLLETIAEKYTLAPLTHHQAVTGGYLSHNQIIGNQDSRYFLKQYRFQNEARIHAIHRAKFFFAEGDIPIILPLRTSSGETYFLFEGKAYALFPFVAGNHLKRGQVSETALVSMAETLAHMHLLGKGIALPGVDEPDDWLRMRWRKRRSIASFDPSLYGCDCNMSLIITVFEKYWLFWDFEANRWHMLLNRLPHKTRSIQWDKR